MRHFCRITGMLCHIFFMFWYIFFLLMFWHILLFDPDIGNLNKKCDIWVENMILFGPKQDLLFLSLQTELVYILSLLKCLFHHVRCFAASHPRVYFTMSHLFVWKPFHRRSTGEVSLVRDQRQRPDLEKLISIREKRKQKKKNWVQTLTARGFLIFYELD